MISKIEADVIVLLQPTSPVRVDSIIDKAIEKFIANDCDTLATGYMSHHFEWGKFGNIPRQKMRGFFHDDGNVYIFDKKILESGRWVGDKLFRMEVPAIYNTEIDNISEFWANEGILKNIRDKYGE